MSIPKNAKRVFQGIIFDVYQWPQKMFDGKMATFEKVVRQNTVVILPVVDGKIVIVKQKQPNTGWFYDLPAGRMDKPGESPLAAAKRELLEETGLAAGNIKLWRTYSPSGKVVQKVYFYVAQNCHKVSNQKLDSGEKIKVLYKTFDEFLRMSDRQDFLLGPLMTDVLLARIHRENRRYLEKSLFSNWKQPPKMPKNGPTTNW